jgi:hypothetical protein
VGIKREWVLGARSDKVWAEIWPDIGPRIDHVRKTGKATWDEGLLLFLERSGYPEETYHTFSYSPVYDDDGTVAGMLCVVTEDTERQLSERRISLLGAIGTEMASTKSDADVFAVLERHIGTGVPDLPCTFTYMQGEDGTAARCVARTGFAASAAIAATSIDADLRDAVASVLETSREIVVDGSAPLPRARGASRRARRRCCHSPAGAAGRRAYYRVSHRYRSSIARIAASRAPRRSRSRPPSRTRAATWKKGGARKRSPSSIAQRRHSSPTSATSSGRR